MRSIRIFLDKNKNETKKEKAHYRLTGSLLREKTLNNTLNRIVISTINRNGIRCDFFFDIGF
jgi:hypothetical protein